MTRDYKHSRAKPDKPTPGWVWMLIGFVMGLLVAFVVYLNGQRALKELTGEFVRTPMATDVREKEQTETAPEESEPRRRFDFYTLLPELEVVIPDEKEERPAKKTPRTPTPPPQTRGGYILQPGSFRKLHEADSMKAKLAMLGVEANIQTVKVNRDTWHRVRIGPYNNLTQLNRVRDRLRKNNVDTLLMKGKD
jgi:cell division protein FtsN